MPKLIMMSGIPTCGKSTYVQNGIDYSELSDEGFTYLSTDNYIQEKAKKEGLTYDEIFDYTIKEATEEMYKLLEFAIQSKMNVIWDQTNLTVKSRRKKLKRIPKDYEKVAVYRKIPLETAMLRNQERPGKIIPPNTLRDMHKVFQPPTLDEGFDKVIEFGEHCINEMQS